MEGHLLSEDSDFQSALPLMPKPEATSEGTGNILGVRAPYCGKCGHSSPNPQDFRGHACPGGCIVRIPRAAIEAGWMEHKAKYGDDARNVG